MFASSFALDNLYLSIYHRCVISLKFLRSSNYNGQKVFENKTLNGWIIQVNFVYSFQIRFHLDLFAERIEKTNEK